MAIMVEIRIEGMTCDHCENTLKKVLQNEKGVIKVCHINWKKGIARVEADENADYSKILKAIESKGYKANLPHVVKQPAHVSLKTQAQEVCDLAIIGAGSAGFAAAIKASDLGAKKIALIEGEIMGGTCVNVGCVPSKTLIRAAEIQHRALKHEFKGISTTAKKVNWNEVRDQKDELVSELRKAKYADVLKNYPSVQYIEGKAKLLSSQEVLLSNNQKLKANKIILSTGAYPWEAPIPGLKEVGFVNSTDVMNLKTLPKSMIVIGASAVGLELAQTLSRLGVKITIIEVFPRIVPLEDTDIGEALEKYLSQEGMDFFVV